MWCVCIQTVKQIILHYRPCTRFRVVVRQLRTTQTPRMVTAAKNTDRGCRCRFGFCYINNAADHDEQIQEFLVKNNDKHENRRGEKFS